MNNPSIKGRNWFDRGGEAYAVFRPQYPPAMASYLASLAPDTQLAVDVGCGTGQLTRLLAPHFRHVIGIDPSADQIANAVQAENISYQCFPAEHLPFMEGSVDLITAAQAAHWFDLPNFYQEVRRVGRAEAVLSLISYGVPNLGHGLNDRFQHFYWHEIGSFWPPERKLVDSGYATLDFPFLELEPPPAAIRLQWDLRELLGYLTTWSAVRHAQEVGREEVLRNFARDLNRLWGNADTKRVIIWKVQMRIGRL